MTYSRASRHLPHDRQCAASVAASALCASSASPAIDTTFGARFFRIDPTILRQLLGPLTSRYAVRNAIINSGRMVVPHRLSGPLKLNRTEPYRAPQCVGNATDVHGWSPCIHDAPPCHFNTLSSRTIRHAQSVGTPTISAITANMVEPDARR